MKEKLNLFSVTERLPNEEEAKNGMLGFHINPEGKAEGTIVFYSPVLGWGRIGKPNKKNQYPIVNINDEIDYWAVIPDDFF